MIYVYYRNTARSRTNKLYCGALFIRLGTNFQIHLFALIREFRSSFGCRNWFIYLPKQPVKWIKRKLTLQDWNNVPLRVASVKLMLNLRTFVFQKVHQWEASCILNYYCTSVGCTTLLNAFIKQTNDKTEIVQFSLVTVSQ